MSAATQPAWTAGDEATPDPLTKALQLASRGLAVLPVGTDKRPALPRFGVMSATTDPQVITDAFIESGAPLVGVACGASGIVVVDIDVHEGGANGFTSLVGANVDLPDTWTHTSLSGAGRHLVYRESGEHAPSKPFPGVDLKAGAGYIVWTGDVPASRDEFAPAPAWTHKSRRPASPEVDEELVDFWVRTNPGAVEPDSPLAGALRDLPPHGDARWNDAELVPLAVSIVRATLGSTGGAAAREEFITRYAAGEWATSAHRRAAARAFARAVDSWGLPYLGKLSAPIFLDTGEQVYPMPVDSAAEGRARSFEVLTRADLKARPKPEWIIRDVMQGAGVIVLAGEGGLGKSFLSVDWAAHIATGQPWQGHNVKRGRVLYVAGEGIEYFDDRVTAWEQHHGTRVPDDRLMYVEEGFTLSDPTAVEDMCAVVGGGDRFDLVVLDTLSQLGGISDENSNAELAGVLKAAKAIRMANRGSSVLIVHHVNKGEKGRVRGASAIRNNVDTVIVARTVGETFSLSTKVEHDGKMKNATDVNLGGFFLRDAGLSAVVERRVGVVDPVVIAVNAVLGDGKEHAIRDFLREYGEDSDAASKKVRRYLAELVGRGLAAQSGTRQATRWRAGD